MLEYTELFLMDEIERKTMKMASLYTHVKIWNQQTLNLQNEHKSQRQIPIFLLNHS